MTWHLHIPKALAAVKQSVAYVFDPAMVLPGVIVGTTTAVSSAAVGRWVVPAYFLFALLVMSTLEMVSCYWVTPKEKRGKHDWETKITGKLLILFLVIVGALLDGMFYFGSQLMPPDWFPSIRGGFLPITLSSLAWVITAEAARTVHNVSRSQGASIIPGAVLWVIRQIRKDDEARWPGQDGPPPRRRIDNLTEDDIRQILQREDQDDPPPVRLEA